MGFMTMGPLGALAGYFIGSWFDKQAVGMQEDLQADEAGRARYEPVSYTHLTLPTT